MGLAGPRNRRKLDYDPNNTRWTRDETTFGQKILRAQGWEPGKFLGSQNTAHAQLHSAASLAPIKVNLKDDTLGLGAKIIQKQSDECTGLDAFKDLLGRLNGKSEETLDTERQMRSEIKTHLVVERKYGPMRFVSGGLLVGDHMKMAELVDSKLVSTPIKSESAPGVTEIESAKKEKREKKDRKSKKRKANEAEEDDASDDKREKKRKKHSKADRELGGDDNEAGKSAKEKKDKKEKKEKKLRRPGKASEEQDVESVEPEKKRKKSKKSKDSPQQDSVSTDSAESSKDAAVERTRKRDKKKDKKRKQADSIETNGGTAATESSITTSATPLDSGSSTPSNTSTSTTQALSARHLLRARYIASKRMAFDDVRALNQIFMVKPI
ncbi:hypothetical protein F5Y14DRAFT_443331 [Nemania sp. NC0429]|nr:hypothetical protein F5Y14DRAFT_443331 [Nemania sp. NC0429]